MEVDELKDKKILILGFGREGQDNFRFLRKLFPNKVLGIADRNENLKFQISNVKWHLGKNYLEAIKNYDLVIKSPGIPFKILPKSALKKITTQTEIFLENCPGKIVGVTGTKGKSTTSTLIYKILKKGGVKVHLVGNIGKPVLSYLRKRDFFEDRKDKKKEVFVYELSSHQLFNLKKSPQIAVFLNIYPEHLDYYKNFNQYLRAKQNITRYQKKEDYFIYNAKNPWVKKTAEITKAKKISIREYSNILKKMGISKISLLGEHNLLNLAAAIEVAKIFRIPKEKIKKAIKNFKPLPHRLEYVGTYKGIKFYNDALSTIPQTTMAALDALGDEVETIFLGGFNRGLDFKNLAKRILKSKIKNLILFPTTGEKIWQEIQKQVKNNFFKLPRAFFVQNMKKAVKLAYQYTQKGKICLLSCASASFSIFHDYKEKGNLFKKYVKWYGQK